MATPAWVPEERAEINEPPSLPPLRAPKATDAAVPAATLDASGSGLPVNERQQLISAGRERLKILLQTPVNTPRGLDSSRGGAGDGL